MERAFFPLDRRLGLLPGACTPQVQGWLVELSSRMPFAAAVKMLATLVGVKVSKTSAMRMTAAAGAAYVALQEEAVAALERQAPLAPRCDEQMVMSADGAMVPLLHGEWGEVRTLAIGVATATNTKPKQTRQAALLAPLAPGITPTAASALTDCASVAAGAEADSPSAQCPVALADAPEIHTRAISYFSRLATAEEFTRQALVETHRRGLENAQRVAAVNDGADWLQTFTDHHCPQALRILDFAHAAQRISETAQALWGQGSAAATSWTEVWTQKLKQAGPQPLLAELRQLQRRHPDNEPLRINLAYLEKRQPQLQYPYFRQQGWPIGSGMVESANKLVVEARLKGAGMHWRREHVNAMLALRNLVCNDHWQQGWPLIQARLRAQTTQRRSAPYRKRLAAILAQEQEANLAAKRSQYAALHPEWLSNPQPELPSPPQNSKPAPDHPWRRSPIGKARFANPQNTKT